MSFIKLFWLSIGMCLVQGATNMLNDYYDYKRQADKEALADEKALVSGEVSPSDIKKLIVLFIVGALSIGVYYSATMSWWILLVIVLAMTVLYLYSAGPRPICYTPFGETAAGITMGFGITTTSIFIQSQVFSLGTVLAAVPTAIFIGALLLANNLSDWQADLEAGRRTSVICLGVKRATDLWGGLMVLMLLLSVLYTFFGLFTGPALLLVLISFPYKAFEKATRAEKVRQNKGLLMGVTSQIGLKYHLSIIAGLLLTKMFL